MNTIIRLNLFEDTDKIREYKKYGWKVVSLGKTWITLQPPKKICDSDDTVDFEGEE